MICLSLASEAEKGPNLFFLYFALFKHSTDQVMPTCIAEVNYLAESTNSNAGIHLETLLQTHPEILFNLGIHDLVKLRPSSITDSYL